MSDLKKIADIMKEGDAHFVLAVGNKDDWIAMIEKDEIPDEPFAWFAAPDAESAVSGMLAQVPE